MLLPELLDRDGRGDVALAPVGAILIAGSTIGAQPTRTSCSCATAPTAGPTDTFGDHGAIRTDLGHGADFAPGLVVDGQGRIVVVGNAARGTVFDLTLVRYRADGTLDPAFDGVGVITVDFHGLGDSGADVALDAVGPIVAAGATSNGGASEFALVRAGPSRST